MRTVQFDSQDTDETGRDLAVIGISAEIVRANGGPGGYMVAFYEMGRVACKLREYLESHHCSETPEGKIKTLPVDGWDNLIEAAVLH